MRSVSVTNPILFSLNSINTWMWFLEEHLLFDTGCNKWTRQGTNTHNKHSIIKHQTWAACRGRVTLRAHQGAWQR